MLRQIFKIPVEICHLIEKLRLAPGCINTPKCFKTCFKTLQSIETMFMRPEKQTDARTCTVYILYILSLYNVYFWILDIASWYKRYNVEDGII